MESALTRLRAAWKDGLIVSCQARPGWALHGPGHMAAMAKAAIEGGAVGLRIELADITAVRQVTTLPIIGLSKRRDLSSAVYITPTFADAQQIAQAGAQVIAIDGTSRPRPGGETLEELIWRIHQELGLPVLADVATVSEGCRAAELGADLIASTLAGYTAQRATTTGPDLELVRDLVHALEIPVLAEGRIHTPEQARTALDCGALAVVVGAAITNPRFITEQFVAGLRR
ncbi:MAG: N-acetylmannosamine-6-phosphate 2-epimerase [Deinococcus sp.]|nr:N-acetylmannosamine-6-phosphate 2-epimerase [Deinococcus sp.]